ncbi:hypothetical protein GCM10010446_29360 [Streptomyces enissocaesilis]|uniref:Uncharacterized protein n=1 Tax=Streptomyces enissocaesilis TaxID=332589 RepID=A0ABP6JSS7_9ACTN
MFREEVFPVRALAFVWDLSPSGSLTRGESPPGSPQHEYFPESATTSLCPGKDVARCRGVAVEGTPGQ